jgi:hypothetical protein
MINSWKASVFSAPCHPIRLGVRGGVLGASPRLGCLGDGAAKLGGIDGAEHSSAVPFRMQLFVWVPAQDPLTQGAASPLALVVTITLMTLTHV